VRPEHLGEALRDERAILFPREPPFDAGQQLAQGITQRQVRGAFPVRDAAAGEGQDVLVERHRELGRQARLSLARLPDDHRPDAATAFGGIVERGAEPRQLVPTARERRPETACHRRSSFDDAKQPVHPGFWRDDLDGTGSEPERGRAEQDLSRVRLRLEPAGGRHGTAGQAHRRVADEHLPRLHADAHGEAVALERSADLGCCPQRTQRIVLVRANRAENRDDLVAEQLLEPAAVTLDDVGRAGQPNRHHRLRSFGVELVCLFDLRKQHGDRLARPPLGNRARVECRRWKFEGRVVREDHPLEGTQTLPRLDAELLDQRDPGILVSA